MRIAIIIVGVCLLAILLYKLNHFSKVVHEEDNIKVRYEGTVFPNVHQGGKHVLYFRNKKVCSDIAGISPNYYLQSPDSKLILYINETNFEKNLSSRYEIYNIIDDSKIIFNNAMYLVGLNSKIEWFGDKIILSNQKQQDILNIKDAKMKIIQKKTG